MVEALGDIKRLVVGTTREPKREWMCGRLPFLSNPHAPELNSILYRGKYKRVIVIEMNVDLETIAKKVDVLDYKMSQLEKLHMSSIIEFDADKAKEAAHKYLKSSKDIRTQMSLCLFQKPFPQR